MQGALSAPCALLVSASRAARHGAARTATVTPTAPRKRRNARLIGSTLMPRFKIGPLTVHKRSEDWHVCLTGNTGIWGCGRTLHEALGDWLQTHHKYLTRRMPKNPKQQALDAITAVLEALKDDANALVRTESGEINPGAAKIELIRRLAILADQ